MTEHYYFAYGSNLSSPRLFARISSAQALTTARLHRHSLAFHMPSQDGSAKCDAHFTGQAEDTIWGVVYQIDPLERPILDHYEGLGDCYGTKAVKLITAENQTLQAFTYYALRTGANQPPYCWYRDHVLFGAREHGLPSNYVAELEGIGFMKDVNAERRTSELSIYLSDSP
jgi:cation transport regulator ChaC